MTTSLCGANVRPLPVWRRKPTSKSICGEILCRTAEWQAADANPAVAKRGHATSQKVVLDSGQVEEDGARVLLGTNYLGLTEQGKRYDHTWSMKMANVERVTISLTADLLRDMDRREKNRSKFVAEAVRRELDRRRRAELRRSLQQPHPESADIAEQGLEEWTRGLPEEDAEALLDSKAGKAVRWVPGEGWLEEQV